MIRSNFGTWLNYATTVVFQILFAARYGTSEDATVFLLLFVSAIAVSGIVASTAQSLLVPRLLTAEGELRLEAVRFLTLLCVASWCLFAAIAVAAPAIAASISRVIDADRIEPVIWSACFFGATQTTASSLATLALARGARFVPAVGPACPSLAGIALLGSGVNAGPEMLFLALSVGGIAQSALVLPAAWRGGTVRRSTPLRVGRVAAATVAQFGLLTLLAPLEILIASAEEISSGAQYGYSSRSLNVAQQLLLGGALLAFLGDWSTLARRALTRRAAENAVRGSLAALMALSLASSVALVFGEDLIAVAYQHGDFTETDTEAVWELVLFALPGFVFEGVSVVLSQLLLATERNAVAVGLGVARFVLRASLAVILGLSLGAEGIAAGYSVASCVVLAAAVGAVHRLHPGVFARSDWLRLAGWAATAVAVGAAIGHLDELPTLGRAAALTLALGVVAWRFGSSLDARARRGGVEGRVR